MAGKAEGGSGGRRGSRLIADSCCEGGVTSNEGEGGNGVRRDSGNKGYLVCCVSAPIVREIMSCVVARRLSWAGNLWWGDEVRQTSITITTPSEVLMCVSTTLT